MLRKIFIFIFCFTLYFIQIIEAKPIVVGIGCNCQPAMKLRTFNLRQAAYPFDWVFSYSLDTVTKCIDDRFEHWLDPDYLEYKGCYIYNNYYGIGFSHDFPNVSNDPDFKDKITPDNFFRKNFKDYIPEIAEKYNRRIQRFLKLLESNESIIFLYTQQGTPESSHRFVQFIKERYPHLDFALVIANEGSPYNKGMIIQDQNIWYFFLNGVKENNSPWWIDEEWFLLFSQLGLLN